MTTRKRHKQTRELNALAIVVILVIRNVLSLNSFIMNNYSSPSNDLYKVSMKPGELNHQTTIMVC